MRHRIKCLGYLSEGDYNGPTKRLGVALSDGVSNRRMVRNGVDGTSLALEQKDFG